VAEISVEEKISAFDEWAAAGFGDMDINGIQDHSNSICYTCSQKGHISPQRPKGKGKGKSNKGKGKGGKGFQGKGFGQYQPKGSWNMKGSWGGGQKGGKSKGKGKGYEGTCWNCNQVGHKQHECQQQRVQAVQGLYQQAAPGFNVQPTMGPIASPEPIHPPTGGGGVVRPTTAGFTQVGSVPVNSVWMLGGGSVPVNNVEVGYKPIALNNSFNAITEAHDNDDEKWPSLVESLAPPQAMKMAQKEAFWMKAQRKERERGGSDQEMTIGSCRHSSMRRSVKSAGQRHVSQRPMHSGRRSDSVGPLLAHARTIAARNL